MNNISINYIILNSIEGDVLTRIVDSCKSKNNNVSLNFNDFSLDKNTRNNLENINQDDVSVSVVDRDYEDSNNAMDIIVKGFVSYADSTIMSVVHENLIFEKELFDTIDFTILDKYGFIYGDYSIDETRCYLRSHAASVKLSIPFVFWSTSKIVDNISQEQVLEHVFNNHMGFHIPKSLCTIVSNDK